MTNAEARCNNSLRPRKPEGSLGRTAQDDHLDSHTAPELCWGSVVSVLSCTGARTAKYHLGFVGLSHRDSRLYVTDHGNTGGRAFGRGLSVAESWLFAGVAAKSVGILIYFVFFSPLFKSTC